MKKRIDFLIVGFGLAGGLLAWELMRRGGSVLVVDRGDLNASQVAAGLINPLTGRRFVKTEEVDRLLPAAKDFYQVIAEAFGRSFFIEKPMRRVFCSSVEAVHCRKRLQDDAYRPYLGNIYSSTASGEGYPGYLEQKQTGYLLIRPLLARLQEFLQSRQAYLQAALDYREIRLDAEPGWRDFSIRKVIFCEGFHMRDNPWFSWLPLQPAKGEILTLEHHLAIPDRMLNDGHWLIPIGDRRVRIGATFDHGNVDTHVTSAARMELAEAGERLFAGLRNAGPIAHEAGVRPCTMDRRPFVGSHPRYSYLSIFNGFGTKGSLSIPWHCRRFADYLLTGEALPERCDIRRYEKTHFFG
ncbi:MULTISPECIES: NAD(P)/FAD-dependent oxidoreductase [Methylomicrobium]|uniref:Glycine/D-amino acid oxidase, deaminating n=1 Tax=Methylomicrobium album BG8 TaxID=686340 RepID=H8GJC9_METAL|nr:MULTISPECIES: FAD-binding oxidoreductase [Methylomicrobium]EIC29119.1 glycine/D-amino acid oxidase, deaminating [Methylomicrobium album BG8]